MNKSTREVMSVLSVATAVASISLSVAPDAWAQQKAGDAKQQIVGAWKLVSTVNTGKDGVTKTGSFGPNPKGMIIFTSSGHYAVVNTRPDLPKFASGSRMQGTPEENKAIVQGSNASFGTYSVSADGKALTLKIESGTWPHWNGTEQKRGLAISGDDMKYTLEASYGGKSELVWKRIK